jgi:hypothetical protein
LRDGEGICEDIAHAQQVQNFERMHLARCDTEQRRWL